MRAAAPPSTSPPRREGGAGGERRGRSRDARRARGDGARALRPGERVPPWYRLPPSPLVRGAGPRSGAAARIVVVGAGLAGCHLVHELARLGLGATLVDAAGGPARGASGNPVGIAKPFVTREPTAAERFHADAFEHLSRLLADDRLARAARHRPIGALQLVGDEWSERADVERLDADGARARAGTALGLDGTGCALGFARAGSLDPRALCRELLERAGPGTRFGHRLVALRRAEDGSWRVALAGPHGEATIEADAVVLANGPGIVATPWTDWLPMTPARGQMTRFAAGPGTDGRAPRTVVAGASWAVPESDGVWAGATYARDDVDASVRAADDEANRMALGTLLPAFGPGEVTASSAGVRATTPDRLPFAGPVPELDGALAAYADLARGRPAERYPSPTCVDGLAVLGGFGSRGIVTAGWTAHLVARWLAGESAPLEAATPLVGPARFVVRPLVRGRVPRLREPAAGVAAGGRA